MMKSAEGQGGASKIDCSDVSWDKCPGGLKELCRSIHCYFRRWKSWGEEVVDAFKKLDKLYDAIVALQDHVYDNKEADLTKRLPRATTSPEVGPPPDPPFGDE